MSEYQLPRSRTARRPGVLLAGVSSLAIALCVAQGAQAQTADRPIAPPQPTGTVQAPPAAGDLLAPPVDLTAEQAGGQRYSEIENRLLRQARFWEARFNREAAVEVLEKVLSINPRNEQALYHLGRQEAQRGNMERARDYLQRLRGIRAPETTVAQLEATIRLYQNQGRLLNEARRLAQEQQTEEAIQQYQQIFGGTTPSAEIAVEYYQTLAGDDESWEAGVRGLQEELERDPDNRQAEFSLAEVLTYREETRREGLDRLRRFAADEGFSERAAQAYRNGLLWLNASLNDKALYDEYLATYPNDAEMQAKFTRLTKPPVLATASPLVNEAYRDLYSGNLDAAEEGLNRALADNPNDADALAALGIIRLRRNEFAGAEEAFARAIEIAPDVEERIADSYKAARFWSAYNRAQDASRRGELQTAERILLEISNEDVEGSEWAQVALADTYVKMDRLSQADTLYREILRQDDDNAAAVMGLVSIAQKRGNLNNAIQLGRRLSAEDRQRVGLNSLEAQLMRRRAEAAMGEGRVGAARRELEAAVSRLPNDPWLRLDYATLLLNGGNRAAAQEQIQEMLRRNPNGSQTKQAAAVYYSRIDNWDEVIRLIDSLPVRNRNAGMRRLLAEAQFSKAIAAAKTDARRGRNEAAIQRLDQLARAYAQDGDKSVAIADAYAAADADAQAVALARRLVGMRSDLSPASLVRLAEILSNNNDRAGANRLLAELRSRDNLPGGFDAQLANLRKKNVLARVRQMVDDREYVEAFDELTPVLEANPRDNEVLRLAGEINLLAGHGDIAYEYFARAISVEPEDEYSISGAVGAALQIPDIDAASRLLEAAISRMPNNPTLYLLAADIAQAAGNKKATLEALEAARTLERRLDGTEEDAPALGRRTPGLYGPSGRRTPGLDEEARLDTAPVQEYAALSWAETLSRRLDATPYGDYTLTLTGTSPIQISNPDLHPSSDQGPSVEAQAWTAPTVSLRTAALEGDADTDGIRVVDTAGQTRDPYDTYLLAQAETEDEPYDTYETERVRRMLRGISEGREGTEEQTTRAIPLRGAPLQESSAARFEIPRAPVPVEQRLEDLRWEVGTVASQFVGVRVRRGEGGISRVIEVSSEIRGETNLFNGRAYAQATPTFITAGDEATGRASYRRYGTNATDPVLAVMDPAVTVEDQGAAGVAIEVGYDRGRFHADVGSTPIGFEVLNLVGGISYDFELQDGWFLRAIAERRAVKDSVLSYSGSEDAGNQFSSGGFQGSGETFGGVTRSGGRGTFLKDFGQSGVYLGGAAMVYQGENTENNNYYEATGGFYYAPIQERDRRLQVGYNTTYFAFDENRSFFTLGHGGYFSPQSFVSASVPVDYRVDKGKLKYSLNGAVGVQYFREDGERFFPDDDNLQALSGAFLQNNERNTYRSDDSLELSFRLGGEVSYRLGDRLEFGARAIHDDTAGYTETSGAIGLRYRFGGGD